MSGASKPTNISTKQDRIAKLAEQMPDRALSSLAHHIDIEWLREAHRRTRKDAAPGVDGKTAEDYEQELEGNLERLLDAAKSGTYRAPPLLANIYLHEVLDEWWVREVQPRMRGQAFLIRYADDAVIIFEREDDAKRVYAALPKRFERFGLHIHPDKTRLVHFERPRGGEAPPSGPGKSRSFDFLGFTHVWGKSRLGRPTVQRTTMKSRFSRAVKAIATWLRRNLHAPLAIQAKQIAAKLRGHDAYYGITGNAPALALLRYAILRVWWRCLGRRSQKGRIPWDRFFKVILARYPLPPPRVVHSVYRSAKL